MGFASFLSGGFITVIVVNPPEKKLAKCTSVHCLTLNFERCQIFMYRYLIKFAGTYIKSYMGVDHPITMVLLIFIFLLGITATTKGAYLQQRITSFMNF